MLAEHHVDDAARTQAAALDCVQPRLVWESQPSPLLPARVLGDEGSLTACLENMLLTAMLWLPQDAPVHLSVSAAPRVALHVTTQRAPAAAGDFTLVVSAETPGRPLTAHEVASILTPFSMLPADKVRTASRLRVACFVRCTDMRPACS